MSVVKRAAAALLLLALLGVAGCADDEPAPPVQPAAEVPAWAKVAPEQIAEAKKHGVPVAFENDLGMRFVLIPAGTFLMGSSPREVGRATSEDQREVTIARPFYIQTSDVTNGQSRRWRPEHDSRNISGDSLDGDEQPADWLSWNDGKEFAGWLSQVDTQREYDLPSSAMWEYACRSATATRFWCGESVEEEWRWALSQSVPDIGGVTGFRLVSPLPERGE